MSNVKRQNRKIRRINRKLKTVTSTMVRSNNNGRTRRQGSRLSRRRPGFRRHPGFRRNGFSTITAPVTYGTRRNYRRPNFTNEKGGSVIIDHTEYIGDISGSLSFTNNVYNINPGLPLAFPWLSSIAQNFESYDMIELEFLFKPTCSTSTAGALILAVDYDAGDPSYTTKGQALNAPSTDGPAWKQLMLRCSPQNLHKFKQRYVRVGTLPSNLDIKTYDTCTLQVITSGMAGSSMIGEMHIHYKVRLMTPQVSTGSTASNWSSQQVTSTTSVNDTNTFGLAQTVYQNLAEITWTNVRTYANQYGQWLTMNYWYNFVTYTALTVSANLGAVILQNFGSIGSNTVTNALAWTAPPLGYLAYNVNSGMTATSVQSNNVNQYVGNNIELLNMYPPDLTIDHSNDQFRIHAFGHFVLLKKIDKKFLKSLEEFYLSIRGPICEPEDWPTVERDMILGDHILCQRYLFITDNGIFTIQTLDKSYLFKDVSYSNYISNKKFKFKQHLLKDVVKTDSSTDGDSSHEHDCSKCSLAYDECECFETFQ